MKKSIFRAKISAVLCAALAVSGVAAGCSQKTTQNASTWTKPKDTVNLRILTVGTLPTGGLDARIAAVNKITKEKLNVTVSADLCTWGEAPTKYSIMVASHAYDIIGAGSWGAGADFNTFAAQNAFLDLNPYLKYVPDLVKYYGADNLKDVEIGGKLFGLPTPLGETLAAGQKATPGTYQPEGFTYRSDLLTKYNLTKPTDFDSIEQYMVGTKKNNPNYKYTVYDSRIGSEMINLLYPVRTDVNFGLSTSKFAITVKDSDPYKLFNFFDSDYFKDLVSKMKKWYDEGLISRDALNSTQKVDQLMAADQTPDEPVNWLGAINGNYANVVLSKDSSWSLGFMPYEAKGKKYYAGAYTSGGTCATISSTTKHPAEALKFIELAQTNQTVWNLLMLGLQAQNYEKVDDTSKTIDYGSVPAAAHTNAFPLFNNNRRGYNAVQQFESWGKVFNDISTNPPATEKNPYSGWALDTTNISNQITAVNNVITQYAGPLLIGKTSNVDADVANLNQKLKEAGIDAIVKEAQTQLTAFAKKKGASSSSSK